MNTATPSAAAGQESSQRGDPKKPSIRLLSSALLLVLITFIAYFPALRAGFIWDDDAYVTNNPMLTAPDGLQQIWFSAHSQSQYFPLVYTTFRLEHWLWGYHAVGYHLVNVAFHAVNALLVWRILTRLKLPGAWLAAALFALHPVNVESVAWVTELKNVESLLFSLLAVVGWLKFIESERPRWIFYVLALIAYCLALFAKTTACTLPAALALIVWLRGQPLNLRRWTQILPFLIIGVAMGLLSIWWEGHLGNYKEQFNLDFTFAQRLLIASRAFWFYLGKMIWPTNLAFSYPRWDINPVNLVAYVPVAACIVAASALWIWRARIPKTVVAGGVFYVATLLPLLGFIPNFTFLYSFVADHYQYVASIGITALVAAAMSSTRLPVWFQRSFQATLLLALTTLVWQQCNVYRDVETLWRDTLSKNPNSWMAHHNLAIELQHDGNLDEAISHYEAAVRLNPKHISAHNNLGLCLGVKGRSWEAIEHFKAAIATDPNYVAAYNNLALCYARTGDYDQAVVYLRRALSVEPRSNGVLMNLGTFLHNQGKDDEAIDCYRQAAVLFPTEAEFPRRLAVLLQQTGRANEAVTAYHDALNLDPTRADILVDLGNLLVSQTNYTQAIGNYRKAVQLQPANAEYRYNLGAVLGLQGDVVEARKELRSAIQLKPNFPEAFQQLVLLSTDHDRANGP